MTDKKIFYIIILIIAAGIAAFLVSRPVRPDINVPVTVVGVWQSTTDAQFTRELAQNGTFFDQYGENIVDTGTWQPFTKNNPVSTDYPLEQDGKYIELIGQTTKTQFKITALGTSTMEMMVLGGNSVLKFVRK